jgi:hypothetical protein
MNAVLKECLTCHKPVKGRTDKKFCDDYCRNSYNNQMHSCHNNYMRHINHLLQKNRRILASLLPPTATHTKTSQQQLQEKGFLFNYTTHCQPNKKGSHYHFCYDYGYLPLEGGTYLIIHKQPAY